MLEVAAYRFALLAQIAGGLGEIDDVLPAARRGGLH